MYLKIENENGTINFAPMTSDNIYVLCKDCGSMVPVNNAEEFDWEEVPFEDIDLCAECLQNKTLLKKSIWHRRDQKEL